MYLKEGKKLKNAFNCELGILFRTTPNMDIGIKLEIQVGDAT
jgi:hypothetical protein